MSLSHYPLGDRPTGGMPTGARTNEAPVKIPPRVFQASPWSNHAEILTSVDAWRISDVPIPPGTDVIRFYLVGAGGNADASGGGVSSGGGGAGGTCVKTVYRNGGLDGIAFAIALAGGGSEADSSIVCPVLDVRMVAAAGRNADGVLGEIGRAHV